ncbi:hypothetical protein [Methanococcoides sp. AM1]|uniref:hypothetical protein n=1 Tax=Methanococcoides sp. AM1 TaxID=1201011 RepID=UPI0014383B91|nr:hypothetical protein [Methanococcoides sp. AM1]
MTESKSIDGVKFCEYEKDVNNWIENNPDKIVVDVKLTSTYNAKWEELHYGCLILYRNK